ncbi:hypothetical protein IZ6_04620 [Terrihabitans soli]|uniref:DUF1178 family protein n=1 Tax=Terrihabitans soli TaxID=708113 RepID=A0A6S6QP79_9HYPH|nr:DUF1178 family protein [Terrihabitans soli]BCJ89727.1 hypothetical protein IZ6_04620 [Terrihabitans soli]
MIRYALSCATGHGFDVWFRSGDDYDAQAKRGLLSCPVCGSQKVEKALMSPAVATHEADGAQGASTEAVILSEKETELREMIRKVRDEVTKHAENVGPRFAEVARQMHDGEIERSSVYGVASADEVRSLSEDGVEFHPLPTLPEEGN